ncbi:DUF4387 domain-containing protein [Hyphomonas sp. CY54-11-8]|jgi:hypothetical protein|uniref:DUF4387 domain-containing protein n=1 Tax=Hyphomonas sp. CY54-11-8 TaxID=1280944 RepID=UPI0009DCF205|nr:DUF4387 domain-containing protein [Hyphomonas sp. CY54-11-8]
MTTLRDIARHVRSKNAGPFWVTVDIFLDGDAEFERVCGAPWLNPNSISQIFGVNASSVKVFPIPEQNVLKISFPRRYPQGGIHDRDQHSGQQFVLLLGQKV